MAIMDVLLDVMPLDVLIDVMLPGLLSNGRRFDLDDFRKNDVRSADCPLRLLKGDNGLRLKDALLELSTFLVRVP